MNRSVVMTEEEALQKSSGYINCRSKDRCGWLIGYLGFNAARTLVATGKYEWYESSCWGYIVLKIK